MFRITKTYQNKYTQINTVCLEVLKHLDDSEKWYKKARIHDLDDEKSLIPPVFVLRALWYKPCVDMFIFNSIDRIVWMPSIQMDQQPTNKWATKKSKMVA
jgi:hypothetical protein